MKIGINTFSTQNQKHKFHNSTVHPKSNYKKKKVISFSFKKKIIKLDRSERIIPGNRSTVHRCARARISFLAHDEDLNRKVGVALSKLRIVVLEISKVLQNLTKLNMDQDL